MIFHYQANGEREDILTLFAWDIQFQKTEYSNLYKKVGASRSACSDDGARGGT